MLLKNDCSLTSTINRSKTTHVIWKQLRSLHSEYVIGFLVLIETSNIKITFISNTLELAYGTGYYKHKIKLLKLV